MAGETKAYSAQHVIQASPWDVYELLTDPGQQAQWRERHQRHVDVTQADPYTRVIFEDGVVMELEPAEDGGTLLRSVRQRSANGMSGRVGRWLTSRKSVEEDMLAELKRIASTAEFDGI